MAEKRTPSLALVDDSKPLRDKNYRVTSYDVAKAAGVSQSAVSRCFKPGASVSKKMRDRVMKVANDLGYQPNAIARSLITRRSNLIAVLLSEFTNLYFPEVLFELNQGFAKRGVHILLFTLHRERAIDEIIEQVFQYQVDGVVVAATLSSSQIDSFENRNIPLVFFNRNIQERQVSSVCCDQIGGERILVNALVNGGHKSFGFISGPDDSLVSIQRTTGARDRLAELGIDNVPIVQGDYTYASGEEGTRQLMKICDGNVDAIICANDMMAISCIDTLRNEFNRNVPDDISVVGFDGIASAKWSSYSLVTIRQPINRMSEAAVDMIMHRIEHPESAAEMRVFSGVLEDGESAILT